MREGLFVDCFLEIGDGFLRVTSSEEEKAVAIVQPDVCGIPAQAFEIIVCRLIGRVAVLLQMKGGEIELFGGGDVFRHFHDAGWFRDGLKLRSFDFMGELRRTEPLETVTVRPSGRPSEAGILCLGLCDEVCGCFPGRGMETSSQFSGERETVP